MLKPEDYLVEHVYTEYGPDGPKTHRWIAPMTQEHFDRMERAKEKRRLEQEARRDRIARFVANTDAAMSACKSPDDWAAIGGMTLSEWRELKADIECLRDSFLYAG